MSSSVCLFVCLFVCVCMYVCMYVCMWVCIYSSHTSFYSFPSSRSSSFFSLLSFSSTSSTSFSLLLLLLLFLLQKDVAFQTSYQALKFTFVFPSRTGFFCFSLVWRACGLMILVFVSSLQFGDNFTFTEWRFLFCGVLCNSAFCRSTRRRRSGRRGIRRERRRRGRGRRGRWRRRRRGRGRGSRRQLCT